MVLAVNICSCFIFNKVISSRGNRGLYNSRSRSRLHSSSNINIFSRNITTTSSIIDNTTTINDPVIVDNLLTACTNNTIEGVWRTIYSDLDSKTTGDYTDTTINTMPLCRLMLSSTLSPSILANIITINQVVSYYYYYY